MGMNKSGMVMMRSILATMAIVTMIGELAAQASVQLDPAATGLNNPTAIENCGDVRLFITERPGTIRILQPNGLLRTAPFLTITDRVNSAGGEQGLLGLAFHPQYAQNGFFYVYYCAGTGTGVTRVSRFSVSADPNVADPTSEMVLWEITQPYVNHNGGDLHFGPDGYLYFAPGDGGSAGDPEHRAQNMSVGFGKIHRIDVDGGAPYTIPPTNPFANADPIDTLRTIFASGLRNPFRFSFDRLTGDLWIGDVGQSTKEEVDLIPAGQNNGPNFGWRCYEGSIVYDTVGCPANTVHTAPIIDHDHADGWCSVIGGRVYRGTRFPNLYGRYIYSDFCHGRIHSLRPNGSGGWIFDTLMTVNSTLGLATFGEDMFGEMYAANTSTGVLYRVLDPGAKVKVSAKVNLEGAYNSATGLMNDALRTAHVIPLTEPYTTALGYAAVAAGGGESIANSILNTGGVNAVVDWIRVELRPAAQPTVVAASRQGLLQRDGDITGVDNTSPLTFHVGPGDYYVVVRHRNHLAVMTAAPVSLTNTTTLLDLRSAALNVFGANARKQVGTTLALWAGDVAANGTISYTGTENDRDPILTAVGGTTPNSTLTGYRMEDVNMDGTVKYTGASNDRDPILVNVGGTTPNGTVVQQVP